MEYNLTDKQKRFLRWLVQQIRDEKITDEFKITWGSKRIHSMTQRKSVEVDYKDDPITIPTLDTLDKLGVLFSTPQYNENRSETGRLCAVPKKLYEIVDSNFEEILIPDEVRYTTKRILEKVPYCDDVIITYLNEAVECLKNNAKLATSIMIGCASEKAIYLLIDTYLEHVKNQKNQEKLRDRLKSRDISKKFDVFKESFNGSYNKPERYTQHKTDFDHAIKEMFDYTRKVRNEVGHPKIIPNIDKDMLIIQFRYFPKYIEQIYYLIDHFEKHGVEISING